MTHEQRPPTAWRGNRVMTWVIIGTVLIVALVVAINVFVEPIREAVAPGATDVTENGDVGDPVDFDEDEGASVPVLRPMVIDGMEISAA